MSDLSGNIFANQVSVQMSGKGMYAIQLYAGEEQLLDETYYNARGSSYVIVLEDVLAEYVKPVLPAAGELLYIQPSAGKSFDLHQADILYTFRIIGKRIALPDERIPAFLKESFLTYTSAIRKVKVDTPCFLTFYTQEASRLRLTATLPDGCPAFQTFSLSEEKVYTLNVTPYLVRQLFGEDINAYQVWIEAVSGRRITGIIDFNICEFPDAVEFYLYANEMGGWDTLMCTGDFTYEHELDTTINKIGSRRIESNQEHEYSCKQNSGYLLPDQEICFHDFLESSQRYHIVDGIPQPIVLTEVKSEFKKNNLNSAEFKFLYETFPNNILRDVPEIILPLPPFPQKLVCCIDKISMGTFYDRITGRSIYFGVDYIDFNNLDSIFNRNGENWKELDISNGVTHWPVYNFDYAFMKKHALGDTLRCLFFHAAIGNNPRTVYPILVYESLSPEEVLVVENYLGLAPDRYESGSGGVVGDTECSLSITISFLVNSHSEVSLEDNHEYAVIGEAIQNE